MCLHIIRKSTMGKRNNRKRQDDNGSGQEDDLSENYTIATETTLEDESAEAGFGNDNDNDSRSDIVVDAISVLSDLSLERKQRSSSHREKVYRQLFKALSQCSLDSDRGLERIEGDWEGVIVPNCLMGLSRSGSGGAEQYAALRCLEVLPIVLGSSNGEGFLDEVFEPLMKAIKSSTACSKVRSVALKVIAMGAFLCGTTGTTLDTLLDLCASLSTTEWRNAAVPNPIRCAAFDCWSILSTLLDHADVVQDDLGKGLDMLDPIKDALASTDIDLRESAGKCFALIHEHRLLLAEHTPNRWSKGSWQHSEAYPLIEDLSSLIHDLSLESSHYISRKAKKTQRAVFRDVQATLEHEEAPSQTVTTASTTLTLNTWNQILIFNFLKQCLQSGLHHHLQHNAIIHQLLNSCNFQDNTASLSQLEKRLTMSKTSDKVKAKDRDMIKQRRSRNNAKNLFIHEDI